MNENIQCPYCNEYTEIIPDDEGGYFESECKHCGAGFKVTVEYYPAYSASKSCELNDLKHKYKKENEISPIPGRKYYAWRCTECRQVARDTDANPNKEIRDQVVEG